MKFDKNSAKKLSDEERRSILIKGGLVYHILGLIIFTIGLCLLISKSSLAIYVLILGLIVFLFGFYKLLLNEEKKNIYINHVLINRQMKESNLSKDEKASFKFKYDEIYKNKVIKDIHKKEDNMYNDKIKELEKKEDKLQKQRINEIDKIEKSRWHNITEDFYYNITEGKIKINGHDYLFNDIKKVELNEKETYRTIDKNNQTISIPTINHLGVLVTLKDFKTEIMLITQSIDKNSKKYNESINTSKNIIDKLNELKERPVPKDYLKPEEEESVKNIDKEINNTIKDLEEAKADTPTYKIPNKYKKKL